MQNDNNSILDTMMDAQKSLLDSTVKNTRKFTNGNALVNETIEKGSEWYKNWLDNQKNVFTQATEKAGETAKTVKEKAGDMSEFFKNWYNTQMNWGKNLWETTQNALKEAAGQASTANPMDAMKNNFTNFMSNWSNMFSNMNTANNWMNNMQQFANNNPFNFEAMKNSASEFNNILNQWNQMLMNGFSEWQGHLQNGTTQDAFRNMLNSSESFTRFHEMWAPMWKSIQDKTFNTDLYKQFLNPASYQDFMDKFFGFMPEGTRQYMQQLTTLMQDGAKQFGSTNMAGFNQFRQMMGNMTGINGNEMFNSMLNSYQNMQSMVQNAVSPIAKMVTQNQYTKNVAEWQDLTDRTMIYNIKNAQLQYMMYAQGMKVMDALAENIATKVQNGEEIKSMLALYQEWMSISDKQFVSLFESDEYSALMAEVSAMQLKLRKDMELQMEKMLVNVPVATRSEMEELYKTIYDLKKEVRQLSKMLDIDGEVLPQTAPKASTAEESAEAPAPKASHSRSKKA